MSDAVVEPGSVRYAGTQVAVCIGDRVTTRVFFFRREVAVVYVPGISPKQDALEHHGLRWVGLRETSGARLSAIVDPESGELDRRVRFVGRGSSPQALEDGAFDEPDEIVDSDRAP